MSGITDSTAIRIHDIIREGYLEPSDLKSFTHTNLVNKLSESTFKKWMQLLQCGDLESRQTFMRLYCEYYLLNKRTMPDSARGILLSGDAELVASDQYQVTYWCEILKRYRGQHPGDTGALSGALEFAAGNLAGTGVENEIFGILRAIAAKDRETAWGYVATLP